MGAHLGGLGIDGGFYCQPARAFGVTRLDGAARVGQLGVGQAQLRRCGLAGAGGAGALDPAAAVPALKATNAPIALEVNRGLSNLRLSVAMARTSAANSATSQFFVNLANNTSLDTNGGGYAVFGSITSGAELVTAMAGAPCVAYAALLPTGECLPVPNLVIATARQTR